MHRRAGLSLLFLFFLLFSLLPSVSCKKHQDPPLPSLDSVTIEDGGSIAQPGGQHGQPQVPFRIDAVHKSQKVLDVAPWHADGGEWTFFDAKTTDGYHFGFGFDATKASGSMAFGKVILTVPGRDDGKKLVELFGKRFSAPVPPETAPQPLAFRPFSAVFLASDARRTTGGFAGKAARPASVASRRSDRYSRRP